LHRPATPATYTLSLHDALPILQIRKPGQEIVNHPGTALVCRWVERQHDTTPLVRVRAAQPRRHKLELRTGEFRGLVKAVEVTRADRKSTRLNSSHVKISYAVFC